VFDLTAENNNVRTVCGNRGGTRDNDARRIGSHYMYLYCRLPSIRFSPNIYHPLRLSLFIAFVIPSGKRSPPRNKITNIRTNDENIRETTYN